jgi:hypothetical protein
MAEFMLRSTARAQHPDGLCAEEYQCIMDLVIKHLFNWDSKTQTSKGVGLFGELLAGCLATEEQGRKSINGHYLVFIKNWNQIMNRLQRVKNQTNLPDPLPYHHASREALALFSNACTSRLFSDFVAGGPLDVEPAFSHEACRSD